MPIVTVLGIVSAVAFVGGFAGDALVRLYGVARKWRWPAKVWSVLLVLFGRDRPAHRHRLQAHRLRDELLMAPPSDTRWRRDFKAPFRISGFVFHVTDLLVVTLTEGEHRGRGEGAGVYYLGQGVTQMVALLEAASRSDREGGSREELRMILPAGGARNAVDCAMWELEAARAGRPAWQLAGLQSVKPFVTTLTIGADEPSKMAEAARGYAHAKAIKIKLTGDLDLDAARVAAVRAAREDVWLGVDANQGFVIEELDRLVASMLEQRVELIEQPLARGREGDLDGLRQPDPARRRRKRCSDWRRRSARRTLPGAQHQARQVRRPYRGAADGRRGAARSASA